MKINYSEITLMHIILPILFLVVIVFGSKAIEKHIDESLISDSLNKTYIDRYIVKYIDLSSIDIKTINQNLLLKNKLDNKLIVDEIYNKCKIELYHKDIRNDFISYKLTNDERFYLNIKNEKKINLLNQCISNFLKTKTISKEDLLYVINDENIKSNLHYEFLKKTFSYAIKDNELTYFELYDVYKNLDNALKLKTNK